MGLRRSSSRVGASSPDQGGRGRVLRREKTSVFDSRYPSLDGNQPSNLPKMPDKRMSMAATGYSDADMMFPMGDRPDLRRRSYHELNYPPHLGPNPLGDPPLLHPQFLHHHHPAAAGPPIQHNFQHTGKRKDKHAPKPPDYSRYPGLDLGVGKAAPGPPPGPPPQHVLPPGVHPPPPTQWLPAGPPVPPFHPAMMGHPPAHAHHHPGYPGGPPPQGRFRGGPMRPY